MEALRQSIAQTEKAGGEKEGQVAQPPRKLAASKRSQANDRKRKSS
jgi:hypothetical protein